ncbi:hypothetical protein GCM10027089_01480 [Nocardia thraciensis]
MPSRLLPGPGGELENIFPSHSPRSRLRHRRRGNPIPTRRVRYHPFPGLAGLVLYLADLAAAAVLEQNPEQACTYLEEALDILGRNWYATAMDRIKAVRQTLRRWDSLPAIRSLDDRLYDWHTTVNSLVG